MASTQQNRDWFKNTENNGFNQALSTQRRAAGQYPTLYFAPLSGLMEDMERMVDQTFQSLRPPIFPNLANIAYPTFSPSLDITATDEAYKISVEIPGVEEKDIKLNVSPEGQLTISGEKRQENISGDKDAQCTECSYGSFMRSLTLPEDVDQDNIEASFRNGVLTITCQRQEMQKQQKREIPISSSSGKRSEAARLETSNNERASQNQRKSA